jgi:hypothetical protein
VLSCASACVRLAGGSPDGWCRAQARLLPAHLVQGAGLRTPRSTCVRPDALIVGWTVHELPHAAVPRVLAQAGSCDAAAPAASRDTKHQGRDGWGDSTHKVGLDGWCGSSLLVVLLWLTTCRGTLRCLGGVRARAQAKTLVPQAPRCVRLVDS